MVSGVFMSRLGGIVVIASSVEGFVEGSVEGSVVGEGEVLRLAAVFFSVRCWLVSAGINNAFGGVEMVVLGGNGCTEYSQCLCRYGA
jgi:hypothetical protein